MEPKANGKRVRVHGPPPPASGALFAALLLFGGCGGDGGSVQAGVVIDTVGGVERVTSTEEGAWDAEAAVRWTLRTDEALRIEPPASAGSDDPRVFGEVSGVLVDAQRRVWVADPMAREIRVFGPEGTLEMRIGRNGEGPGEFRHLSGLTPAPDGIAALDGQLGRVSVFDDQGELVRSFRLERPYMILEHNAPMAFDPRGRFLDRARLSRVPGVDSIGVTAYDAVEPPSTALLLVAEQDLVMLERNGVPMMSIPRPFAPPVSMAFGPEGRVYTTRGDSYRIDVSSPDGDRIRILERSPAPVPVGDDEWQASLDVIAEIFADAGGALPADLEPPSAKAPILRLLVDATGHLWVAEPTSGKEAATTWAIHDPEGRHLGRIEIPRLQPMYIGERHVAGVERDELGVPAVVVIPLDRGEP
jgi:hypothetical protein